MNVMPSLNEMRRAHGARDCSYDGVFFVGVRSTGIFCRPSCPARAPLPRNVTYFASPREATFAGFRPCKRCRPLDINGAAPTWVQRLLDAIDADPARRIRDGDLRAMGVDPARARRHFQKQFGMSFHAYQRGRRMHKALQQIRRGEALDEVALGHGYESHSGFREAFERTVGTAPGRARDADCIRVSWVETPLGPMVAGASDAGLCLLEFTERRMLEAQFASLRRHFRCAVLPGENGHLRTLKDELARYFAGELRTFSVPLVYPGSAFQRQVWDELRAIPYGQTRSYQDLARAVGRPAASRAVGTANGLNRIAVVIPCHRVVNKDGRLGGYGGGVWRKARLLALECGEEQDDKR